MRSIAGLLVVLCSVPSVVLAQAAGPTPLEVARALGASDPDHAPTWADGEVALRGPAERAVTIDAAGAAWVEGGTSVRLGLSAIGRGRMEPVVSGALRIDGPEARAVRGDGIEEWWRSLPNGLEHGVDLARRPAGEGELLLEVAADGLVATLDEGAITLGTPSTPGALIYSGLEVVDAGGARLPARLDVVDGAIVIRVDDRGARYPVSVDPILATLEATLTGPSGRFGWAVSVSADGTRAAVSAIYGGPSSVTVLRRTGTTWTEEQRIAGTVGEFGTAVSLSAAGDLLAIGIPEASSIRGAVEVWARTGTTWSREATLQASDGVAADSFGFGVALSADGGTLVAGAWGRDGVGDVAAGAAYVFDRGSTGWTEVALLLPAMPGGSDRLGYSVGIDDAGDRIVLGAWGADAGWVFVRGSSGWVEEARLDPGAFGRFGLSCALDATGTRAMLGGIFANAAVVFVRSGSTWSREATLRTSDSVADDEFGHWVRFARGGTQAWVSARSDDTAAGVNAGTIHLFTLGGGTWTEELTIPGTVASGELGYGFDVTPDGSRLVGGAWGASRALVFTLAGTNGEPCGAGSACTSGFCVDGVCCDSACGDGGADCQACTAALTGGTDGRCAPIVAGTECRASAGACDPAEACDGVATACPAAVVAASGTECRASLGACDPAEVCDGASAACPGDARSAAGVVCSAATGPCTAPAVCDGASAACPAALLRPAGTVCLPADPLNLCDADDLCDGTTDACAPSFAPDTQACGSPASDVCDAPDHCTGTSAECIAAFLADVECRPSTASCDPAESCTGSLPTCPDDVNACVPDAGTDGGMMTIDAAMADAGAIDGGASDGGASDGGAGADAGTPPATGGCACRAGHSSASPVLALAVLALIAARRRR